MGERSAVIGRSGYVLGSDVVNGGAKAERDAITAVAAAHDAGLRCVGGGRDFG